MRLEKSQELAEAFGQAFGPEGTGKLAEGIRCFLSDIAIELQGLEPIIAELGFAQVVERLLQGHRLDAAGWGFLLPPRPAEQGSEGFLRHFVQTPEAFPLAIAGEPAEAAQGQSFLDSGRA